MADLLGKDDAGSGDSTLDFLGRPAPVAFKSQPALPTGGPIGVGTGPRSTATGGAAPAPGLGPKRQSQLQALLADLGDFGGGEGGTGPGAGSGSPDAPGVGSITGVDPGAITAGLGFLGGVPGLGAAAKGGISLGKLAAGLVDSNLNVITQEGPQPAFAGSRVSTGVPALDGLLSFLGIPGLGAPQAAFTAAGMTAADAAAITAALANAEFTLTPEQLSMLANAVQHNSPTPNMGHMATDAQLADPSLTPEQSANIAVQGLDAFSSSSPTLGKGLPGQAPPPPATIDPPNASPTGPPDAGPPGDAGTPGTTGNPGSVSGEADGGPW